MRSGAFAILCGLCGVLLLGPRVYAQTQAENSIRSAVANQIMADSSPYRIEWNGSSGVFIRKAFAQEPETRQPLVFLHTDAGPTGYAKHLAWFLARDDHSFSLLWCYLNDSGSEFNCWLYRFPSNQLTALHFTGDYQYTSPAEPVSAKPLESFKLEALPPYVGPAFSYRDWTTQVGSLKDLGLRTSARTRTTSPADSAVTKTLTELRVRPLHQVEVGEANGWREGGWNELHALAFDKAEDPYYLILYSNTTTGYAVDLKRAQIYTADYGTRVAFERNPQGFGPNDNPLNIAPSIKVPRYERHEIVLTTKQKLMNPYVEAQVGVEFRGPDAKPIVVPGFWDGGGTFRVRFAPTETGTWTWRSLSRIDDLNGESGAFECTNEDPGARGFVSVQPNYKDPHHFSYSNGDPFLPVLMREPVPAFVSLSGSSAAASDGHVRAAGFQTSPVVEDTASFVAYQKFVNAAIQKGFNRFVGGYLLGPAAARQIRADEGGPAVLSMDLDQINPAFFQWMDRRIAYCNARGIVPDIGLGTLEDGLFTTYNPAALFRLWAYVVARYASFNVQWNLFEAGGTSVSPSTQKNAEQFAQLTRLYDPVKHPITLILPNANAAPSQAAPPSRTAQGADPQDTTSARQEGRRGRPDNRSGGAAIAPAAVAPTPAPGDTPWLDVISLLGGDVNSLPVYSSIQKPMVLLEHPVVETKDALTPDVARHRMWEARFRGAYWVSGIEPTADAGALNAPELQWAAACGDLFRQTRFYRLAPHPEMLGGDQESPADRKRRKRAEAAAKRQNPSASSDDAPPAADAEPFDPLGDPFAETPAVPVPKPTPMFILADPAREYLVYFEQGGSLLLDLLEATGKVTVTWFNPRTGEFSSPTIMQGGVYTRFNAPDANDWVLHVARK